MKKPILLLAFLLCALLTARPAPASPLSDYWDEKEVRAALDALPDLEKIERTLHFEVRDADTDEILPEVSYSDQQYGQDQKPEPVTATGRYDYKLPQGLDYVLYTVRAPGYGTQMKRLMLGNHYDSVLSIQVHMQRAKAVSGRVLNEEGVAIEGVKVGVTGYASRNPFGYMNYSGDAVTDAEGIWKLDDFPLTFNRMSLSLIHPDYQSDLYAASRRDIRWVEGEQIIQTMKHASHFKGRVVNESGAPLPKTLLKISNSEKAQAESDENGAFVFQDFVEDYLNRSYLRITAAGYADQYLKFGILKTQENHEIVMKPGLPLRLHFLAPDGAPLAHKKIFISVGLFGNQMHFMREETDASGSFVVKDAPVNALWGFGVSGNLNRPYQPLDKLSLTPGDTVHEVRFQEADATFIALLVVDDETDKPLESFNVIRGSVQEKRRQQQDGGWWSPDFWLDKVVTVIEPETATIWHSNDVTSASRIFQTTYSGYKGGGNNELAVRYRVEAEGYYPVVTPPIEKDYGEVFLKLRMKRGEALRVRALDPQGAPLVDAVATWIPNDNLVFFVEGSSRQNDKSADVSPDKNGWLKLPVIEQRDRALLVLSAKGFALVNGATLRNEQNITLEKWERVEGTVTPKVAGIATRGISMGSKITMEGIEVHVRDTAHLDPSGRFTAEHLLPGEYTIGPAVEPYGETISWTKFTIRKDETAQVNLKDGRAVKGQLEMPAEAWALFRKEPIKIYFIRTDIPSDRYSTFMTSKADGSFGISALPPGDYKIDDSYIVDPDEPSGMQRIQFKVEPKPFSITTESEDTPLDVGILQFKDVKAHPERPIQKEDDGLLGTILKALQ